MQIRRAAPSDSAAILRLFRRNWAPNILALMPLGAAGAGKFLKDSLHPYSESTWFVCEEAGIIDGALEARRLSDELFINQLQVRHRQQHRGLGRLLFRTALDLGALQGSLKVSLDVFSHLEVAREWYLRLGFSESAKTFWSVFYLDKEPLPASKESSIAVRGWPQAQAAQRRFGFSEFSLLTAMAQYKIGRLGLKFYRCSDASLLQDEAALHALRTLEATRHQVLILSHDPPTEKGISQVAESARMSAEVSRVRRRLTL